MVPEQAVQGFAVPGAGRPNELEVFGR
jgi:hypothetical protein